jgi:rfaE bifunctional protein kinase chain/domain/rfaE bifunctional protein nucleotidyltransferase chain/domain
MPNSFMHTNGAHVGSQPRSSAAAREKIKTLAELADIVAGLRNAGETVVFCHGVFDLLHMGHVRHLEEARKHGTKLIVSVTPDRFVNKGPGRPVFKEQMRAEMIAALASVDWVMVNEAPTAEHALGAIKPHIYAKGSDYADPSKDVTNKITAERQAVERHGGKLVFTDDVTFSSSELINRYLNPFNPTVRAFLDSLRDNRELDDILALIEKVSTMRVLIVGDTILDEYRYVAPMSKTPKENLIATLFQSSEIFAGGAIATANHVAGICKEVDVMSVLGAGSDGYDRIRSSIKPNVNLDLLAKDTGPTTLKCRYIDSANMRKLFEVYQMDDTPIADQLQWKLNDKIAKLARDYDAVIVNDFGHGMIQRSTVDTLTRSAKFLAVNTQTNSANFGYNLISKYHRADYVCVDGSEARLAAADKFSPMEQLVTERITSILHCPKIVVTQGQYGCIAYSRNEPACQVPAFADKVVDTVGAGDAFLAITSPLVASGGAMRHVAFIGNVAGAIKVNIVGHRQAVDKPSLIKAVTGLLK